MVRSPSSRRTTRPGCSSTHSAGSPGAWPTQVGRFRPVGDPLDVEVVPGALLGGRLERLDVVERVAAEGDVADGQAGRDDGGDEDGDAHGAAY